MEPKPLPSAIPQGQEKGKGKEAATDKEQPCAGDSFVSRVGKSASELSRSVLQGTPTATDVANTFTAEKSGAPSSSKSVALAEGFPVASASSSFGNTAFRSGQADAHIAAEESAFSDFLDNTPAFVPAEPVGLEHAWQETTGGRPDHNVYEESMVAADSSVAEQEECDGFEVVHLLSRVDGMLPMYDGDVVVPETELKSLREALFGDGSLAQLSATDWNNALNFIPNFLRDDGPGSGRAWSSEDSYLNLGVTEPAEAGSLWLEQWNRVLTSYTDEVWGDLGDLVRRAQTEVKQMEESNNMQPTAAPAVRQLRSILTRVRARL